MSHFEVDDLIQVAGPLKGSAPLARWERKERSARETGDRTPKRPKTPRTPASRRTPGKTPRKTPKSACRFIPNRSAMDLDVSNFNLTKENAGPGPAGVDQSPAKTEYKNSVAESMSTKTSKVLAFKQKAPTLAGGSSANAVLYTANRRTRIGASGPRKVTRVIPKAPEKILDAPDFVDDYYLNLLDWSPSNNLAIGLGSSVYVLNCATNSISELVALPEAGNYVTSLSWMQDRDVLAVGTAEGKLAMWDAETGSKVRSMDSHSNRVSSLSWNRHTLSSGSRDSEIHHHDVRIRAHHTATLAGHSQEVCGLRWSPDGTTLASGGNDNLLNIWSVGSTRPRFTFNQHQAAVKALAWCPWQAHTLASGGGTADRTLRIWNTQTGAMVNSIDTRSQVCSILWSKTYKELVSSHGFSQNQLAVWKYPSMAQIGELTGHSSRVLHMAMSPDGSTVASAAGDETLRFWKVFEAPNAKSDADSLSISLAAKGGLGSKSAARAYAPTKSVRIR